MRREIKWLSLSKHCKATPSGGRFADGFCRKLPAELTLSMHTISMHKLGKT
jgi:hypothetical protein